LVSNILFCSTGSAFTGDRIKSLEITSKLRKEKIRKMRKQIPQPKIRYSSSSPSRLSSSGDDNISPSQVPKPTNRINPSNNKGQVLNSTNQIRSNNESIKMTRSISNDNGVTNITINKEMEPNHNNVKSSNRNEAVPDLIKVTSDLNPDSLVWEVDISDVSTRKPVKKPGNFLHQAMQHGILWYRGCQMKKQIEVKFGRNSI
jgi:hypothetical protein